MVDSWPKAIYLCNRECVLCGKIDQIRLCWSENEFSMPAGLFVSGGGDQKADQLSKWSNKWLHHVRPLLLTWGTYQHLNDIEESWSHKCFCTHSVNRDITRAAHFLQDTQETDACMIINTLLWLWNIDVEIIWEKYFYDVIVTFNSQVVLLFCSGKFWFYFFLPCFPLPKLFSIPNKCVPNEVSD